MVLRCPSALAQAVALPALAVPAARRRQALAWLDSPLVGDADVGRGRVEVSREAPFPVVSQRVRRDRPDRASLTVDDRQTEAGQRQDRLNRRKVNSDWICLEPADGSPRQPEGVRQVPLAQVCEASGSSDIAADIEGHLSPFSGRFRGSTLTRTPDIRPHHILLRLAAEQDAMRARGDRG